MSSDVIRKRPEMVETSKIDLPPQLLKVSEIPTGQVVLKLPRRSTNLPNLANAGYQKIFFIARTARSARQLFGSTWQEMRKHGEPVLDSAKEKLPLLAKHLGLQVSINVAFGSWGYGTKPSYFYANDLKGLVKQLQAVNFDHIPLSSFILPNDECQWIIFQPKGDSYLAIQFGQKMYDEVPTDKLMSLIEHDTRLVKLGGYACAMRTATYKGITCEPIKKET